MATTPPIQALTGQPVQAAQTLQIEATNLLGLPPPALNIGDVVQLVVRQNPPEGQGSVALRGTLIKANLPPNLQQGDRINAQIVQSQDRVIFKIIGEVLGIDDLSEATATQQSAQVQRFQSEFEEIFRAASATSLRSLQSGQIADNLS